MGEAPTISVLEIHLLGNFRVVHDGTPLTGMYRPRLQALFAWLVLHAGVPQSRTGLAGRFWPESSEEQAHTNLRKVLFELRHALPAPERFVNLGRSTVEWRRDGPFTVDVEAFEQAARTDVEKAIALYTGDLLPDCYDDWVIAERERLQRIYQALLRRGLTEAEKEGDFERAIEYAQRLRLQEPLQEDTYRALMHLYTSNGDRAGALRTYHLCASTLERELGVEPSESTKEAYEQLLEHRELPDVPAAVPLVGRTSEIAALRRAWREAERGAAGAVVLVGDPGIGKTRLAEELVGWASDRGVTAVSARCYPAEGRLAFAPVAALLRSLQLPPLDPVWLTEIARLLPDVLQGREDVLPPSPLTEPWQRGRMFEALARFLLAHQPLLVLIDDFQWCDPDSVEWLHYLLRFDPRARLLLLCTLRPEGLGTGGERAPLWLDLKRHGRLEEIELGPLDAAATGRLAQSVASSELDTAALERLARETEGNPLYILEMARAGPQMAGAMPPTIRAVIESRLQQLSPAARELAGLAATIGRAFRFSLLVRASDRSETESIGALDELWRARIVREQGEDEYDFSHEKLREVAYGDLSSGHRRLLHRRVAEALEAMHAGDLAAVGGQLGRHLEQAGMPERAARYYALAGTLARRLYATEAATDWYRRALGLAAKSEQIDIMLKLVEVLQLAGTWSEAETLCRQAVAQAERLGDAEGVTRCRLALGDLLRLTGRHREALPLLERAQGELEELGDQVGLCRVTGLLGRLAWDMGDMSRALQLLEAQLQRAVQLGDRKSTGDALGNIALVYWRQADLRRAQDYLEQQCQIAREEDDREQLCRALCNLAINQVVRGGYTEALNCLQELLEMARSIGYVRAMGHALCWTGIVQRHRGELSRALSYLEQQLRIARDLGERAAMAYAAHEIGIVYEMLGDEDRALANYEEALPLAEEVNDLSVVGMIVTSIGRLYEHADAYAEAVACHTASAHIALNTGDRFALGPALAALARTYMAQGHNREAETVFEHALRSPLTQPYERCECVQEYAELLFRLGRYEDARRLNQDAQRLAEAVGRKEIELDARLLAVRLDLDLNTITRREAVNALNKMLTLWSGEVAQGAIHFATWQLDGTCEESRCRAAEVYRHLYERTPRSEYRSRYRLLTGRNLPPPPPVPTLPGIVTRYALDPDELLALVEHLPELSTLSAIASTAGQ